MSSEKLTLKTLNKDPIIIVDDSAGERELVKIAFEDLGVENELIFFENGADCLKFIKKEERGIFFILCDVNMPIMTGMELKKILQDDDDLRLKSIPFILISTSNATSSIMKAYSFGVQGYFVKPQDFDELLDMLTAIITYWDLSESPK